MKTIMNLKCHKCGSQVGIMVTDSSEPVTCPNSNCKEQKDIEYSLQA